MLGEARDGVDRGAACPEREEEVLRSRDYPFPQFRCSELACEADAGSWKSDQVGGGCDNIDNTRGNSTGGGDGCLPAGRYEFPSHSPQMGRAYFPVHSVKLTLEM